VQRRVTVDLSVAGAFHTTLDMLRVLLTDRSNTWVVPHLAPSKPTTPAVDGKAQGRNSGGRSSPPRSQPASAKKK
jgi:hypothetical protein